MSRTKRVFGFIILCFAFAPVIALAADWVYADKSQNGDETYYVDRDSVSRDGNTITYWMKVVYSHDRHGMMWSRYKMEVILSNPRRDRDLEFYAYDADGNVLDHETSPGEFSEVPPDTHEDTVIDTAVRLAR